MRRGNNAAAFSEDAKSKMLAYDWPGNVRQLRNVIENAVLFCDRKEITPDLIRLPERAESLDRLRANIAEQPNGQTSCETNLSTNVEKKLKRQKAFIRSIESILPSRDDTDAYRNALHEHLLSTLNRPETVLMHRDLFKKKEAEEYVKLQLDAEVGNVGFWTKALLNFY